MKKCLVLISDNKDNDFYIQAMKNLAREKKFRVAISKKYEDLGDQRADFVFCFNYRRIIPEKYIRLAKNGIYVFHSSDLPDGKGWAPIYHSLISAKPDHVLTALKIDATVDGGEIIAKTYFRKRAGENADSLRSVDNLMTIATIKKIINDLLKYKLTGQIQPPNDNYRPKRNPEDSEITIQQTIEQIHRQALAVTGTHPLFYHYQGKKYLITIRSESLDPFRPQDIRIKTFYEKHSA
jgi:methionyl-tRNA formyltransferase